MRLLLDDGIALRIGQMGPDFLILDSPMEHPPSDASIELRVDESQRSWKMRLPNGISERSHTVVIARML
jgi:hypothetical protein